MIASWFLTWWQPIAWPVILLGSEAWRARQQAAIDLHRRRPSAKSTIAFSRFSPFGCRIGLGSIGDGQRPCRLRSHQVGSVLIQSPRADHIGFRAGLPLDGIIRIARIS